MYIRKRRKKWQCLVRHKGHRVAHSFASKSDARLWGQKVETELMNGSYQNNDKLVQMTLKDLLQLYLEKAMHKSKRPKILKYDVEMLRRFPMARSSLAALSAVKLANFRDERLKAGKSTSTVRCYLKTISRAITVGQKELGIPLQTNPVSLIEKPKQAAPRDRTLSRVELDKLLAACREDKKFHFLAAFVEVAFLTICRRGELLNLKWENVDWIDSTAHIAETKTDKPRKIGLAPKVLQILKALPRTVNGIFFPVRSMSSFEKSFRNARKRAGIKDFRIHDLRHSGARYLIEEKNFNTMELMEQGGWSSAAMAKRYANISPKHLAKKLELMAEKVEHIYNGKKIN
jgi:integrase